MRADWALRLYPEEWKRRYMSEMRFVLAEHPTTTHTHADMLRGAADAWLQFGLRPLAHASTHSGRTRSCPMYAISGSVSKSGMAFSRGRG